jgi:N6-adenosine-specific RNA methylase IME4
MGATKYRTIVADPPWTPEGSARRTYAGRKGYPQLFYPTMSLEDICAIRPPVGEHLWLWSLPRHLDWGWSVARAWGYEPLTCLTWCKPGLGVGRFQTNSEHVLVARRGNEPFGMTGGSWFRWPRGRHSEKPDAFYDLVESVSPGPYLELFARRQRLGWDTWGNEALNHVTLDVTKQSTERGEQNAA